MTFNRNRFLRGLVRAYPLSKGRYRLMKLCESGLRLKDEVVPGSYGEYRFALKLPSRGLQSSFYYFLPELYESETQRYIRETVGSGQTVMDVGAHVGLFTLLMACRVGPQGRVYSLEPEKNNFAQLENNIRLNGLNWVTALPVALSDRTGEADMAVNREDSGHALAQVLGNSLRATDTGTQRVRTMTLDDLLEQYGVGRVDLMKIDAEASEHLILRGAARSLSRKAVSRVICEVHASSPKDGVGGDSIRKAFYAHGYRSFVLNSKLSGKPYLSELAPDEPIKDLLNLLFKP